VEGSYAKILHATAPANDSLAHSLPTLQSGVCRDEDPERSAKARDIVVSRLRLGLDNLLIPRRFRCALLYSFRRARDQVLMQQLIFAGADGVAQRGSRYWVDRSLREVAGGGRCGAAARVRGAGRRHGRINAKEVYRADEVYIGGRKQHGRVLGIDFDDVAKCSIGRRCRGDCSRARSFM